jgi:hypothetical protein
LRNIKETLGMKKTWCGDAYYAAYFLIATLQRMGVDFVFEQHGARGTDFRATVGVYARRQPYKASHGAGGHPDGRFFLHISGDLQVSSPETPFDSALCPASERMNHPLASLDDRATSTAREFAAASDQRRMLQVPGPPHPSLYSKANLTCDPSMPDGMLPVSTSSSMPTRIGFSAWAVATGALVISNP